MENLEDFINESYSNLREKAKKLDDELKDSLESVSDNHEEQMLIDNFLDENNKYFKEFPCYLHESLLLMTYSFFEISLARICHYAVLDINARKPKKITSQAKDVHTQNSKKFLTTDCSISLAGEEATWKKLDKLRDLRNFIAHNNMDMRLAPDKAKKKATIAYINRVFGKGSVVLDKKYKYIIESEQLIVEALQLVKRYLNYTIEKSVKKAKSKS